MRKALRFEVLRRDNFTCVYCGAKAPDTTLHVDHVVPESLGGLDEATNLVTACEDCNQGKAGRTLTEDRVEQVAADAARWSAAMAQAAQEHAARRAARDRLLDFFWQTWTAELSPDYLEPDWDEAIERFDQNGLSTDDLYELVQATSNSIASRPWRYFCGCCQNRIRQYQERAMQIMREADGA